MLHCGCQQPVLLPAYDSFCTDDSATSTTPLVATPTPETLREPQPAPPAPLAACTTHGPPGELPHQPPCLPVQRGDGGLGKGSHPATASLLLVSLSSLPRVPGHRHLVGLLHCPVTCFDLFSTGSVQDPVPLCAVLLNGVTQSHGFCGPVTPMRPHVCVPPQLRSERHAHGP